MKLERMKLKEVNELTSVKKYLIDKFGLDMVTSTKVMNILKRVNDIDYKKLINSYYDEAIQLAIDEIVKEEKKVRQSEFDLQYIRKSEKNEHITSEGQLQQIGNSEENDEEQEQIKEELKRRAAEWEAKHPLQERMKLIEKFKERAEKINGSNRNSR